MPTVIEGVERKDRFTYIHIKDHTGTVFNFRIDFKERIVGVKDGFSWNGQWHDIDTKLTFRKNR